MWASPASSSVISFRVRPPSSTTKTMLSLMKVLAFVGPFPYSSFMTATILFEICLSSSPRGETGRSVALIGGKLLLADTLCCAFGDLPDARQLAWVTQERGSGQP